jgi:hypothetical protein
MSRSFLLSSEYDNEMGMGMLTGEGHEVDLASFTASSGHGFIIHV